MAFAATDGTFSILFYRRHRADGFSHLVGHGGGRFLPEISTSTAEGGGILLPTSLPFLNFLGSPIRFGGISCLPRACCCWRLLFPAGRRMADSLFKLLYLGLWNAGAFWLSVYILKERAKFLGHAKAIALSQAGLSMILRERCFGSCCLSCPPCNSAQRCYCCPGWRSNFPSWRSIICWL